MTKTTRLWSVLIGTIAVVFVTAAAAFPEPLRRTTAIPAFSRLYRTACSTCHIAAPKLNVLGETFRINGYRMPVNDLLIRRDEPVPLGDDAWKDQWPRGIWPGEVPGQFPLALRIQSDLHATRDPNTPSSFTYRLPHEVYLLAGANLGGSIAAFLETEWSPEEGLQVVQAKVEFQDIISMLPQRALNLWIGLQNLYLFTFADRQIDRAGRQQFRWQQTRASDFAIQTPGGQSVRSANAFRLGMTQPAIEINGIVGNRISYAVGAAQGAGGETVDNNAHKDLYFKLRYKIGGLDLLGHYPAGSGPVLGTGGQLLDRSVILEHFSYFGSEPSIEGGVEDRHRSFGFNARTLQGRTDLGIGVVHTRHRTPWGSEALGALSATSLFGKLEYLYFPWLIGSLKFDWFETQFPDETRPADLGIVDPKETRVLPGVIMLFRQNVRGVIEAEWFPRHTRSDQLAIRRPHAIWLRLDVAF